jgi:glycosyltransferase involved in cell wall biosynthesis
MKPNILLITSVYPPQVGGPAIFTSRFSRWLLEKNYSVNIITYLTDKKNDYSNVSYITLRQNRLISFIEFIFKILTMSGRNTLILSNGAFIETYIACRMSRRKYILKIPGDHVWELSKNRGWTKKSIEEFQFEKLNYKQRIFRMLNNLALKNADFVITPSIQLSVFAHNWGVKKEKIKIIYNCVNPDHFDKIESQTKQYDLVTTCRLVPWKGLEELIKISIRLNLKLLIIGDGPLLPHLKSLAQGETSNISFAGRIENSQISKVLSTAKIFVLNSEYEATSYALIEAKMCGLPVLAKRNDGSLTVVRDGIDGFVYSASEGFTLDSAIIKLSTSDELLESFASESRIDALLRFNEKINFAKILDLMEI